MRRPLLLSATAIIFAAAAAPSQAQMTVTDPGAYARMLRQIREAQAQLTELRAQVQQGTELIGQGKALYDSLNKAADVNSIGVNRRPKGTPYRRAKGTPFVEQRDGYDGRAVRAGCGVGRA